MIAVPLPRRYPDYFKKLKPFIKKKGNLHHNIHLPVKLRNFYAHPRIEFSDSVFNPNLI